ncbi:MAG: putative hydro-lyase [Dehalococcoidales bacterium]
MPNNITQETRQQIRQGKLLKPTCGLSPGFTQANLVVLPREYAFDFLLFCQRNPKPCPVLEVLEPGSHEPVLTAPGADIRTDIALYRVYQNGKFTAETEDIKEYWNSELVSFLLGCSFTFETALLRAGIEMRHIDEGQNVPMYVTSIQTATAGMFHGPMVVSMRPIPRDKVVKAVQITSRYPGVHGAPVHIGEPEIIGVTDLSKPDYGDPVAIRENEIPVFWACGVTPQAVALESKPAQMITHSPGHMFITDILDEDLAVL